MNRILLKCAGGFITFAIIGCSIWFILDDDQIKSGGKAEHQDRSAPVLPATSRSGVERTQEAASAAGDLGKDKTERDQEMIRKLKAEAVKKRSSMKSGIVEYKQTDPVSRIEVVTRRAFLNTEQMRFYKITTTAHHLEKGTQASRVILRNLDGAWTLVGDTAIMDLWKMNPGKAEESEDVEAIDHSPAAMFRYSLASDVPWKGTKWLVIKEQLTEKEYRRRLAAMKRRMKTMQAGQGNGDQMSQVKAETILPSVVEYWIDPNQNLILRTRKYNHKNNLLDDSIISSFEIDPVLSDNEFEVPSSYQVVVADSDATSAQFARQASAKIMAAALADRNDKNKTNKN